MEKELCKANWWTSHDYSDWMHRSK